MLFFGGFTVNGEYKSRAGETVLHGSILDCLLRKKNGETVEKSEISQLKSEDLLLTCMLDENNRMNESLNSFTALIYGKSYKSNFPGNYLAIHENNPLQDRIFDQNLMKTVFLPMIQMKKSIITIECRENNEINQINQETQLSYERNLIGRILEILLTITHEKEIFIVVPHRAQRVSIEKMLISQFSSRKLARNKIKVDTVDKMQGQESSIVIISYLFFNKSQISNESSFLFDRRRINVSISRAKNLCILLGSSSIFYPPVDVLSDYFSSIAYQHLFAFYSLSILQSSRFQFSLELNNSLIYDDFVTFFFIIYFWPYSFY